MKAVWTLAVLIVAALCAARNGHADEHCAIHGIAFASCSPKARYFQSVVIAIPGWNGKCRTTFGEGAGNLLNAMRQSVFFDVDCFDYDSNYSTLAVSRELLRKRLEALAAAGYREFAFVTHSTGGILALDLLLTEALDQNGALRSRDGRSAIFDNQRGARLRALYSWAIPLNGLRDGVTFAGRLANLANLSPAVLPLLAADSAYLAGLKDRLKRFDATFATAGDDDRADYAFRWVILQGQNDDGVVRNILSSAPWFPSALASRVVNTQSAHSHNVADGGDVDAPLYPAEMMADKALLALGLRPRSSEYFAATSPRTQELGRQQRIILGGVLGYAGNPNLFDNAYRPVSEFTILMLQGSFPRDARFDEEVVAGLSRLLNDRVRQQDRGNAVHFADRLLNDIERGLDVRAIATDRFGGGTFRAVRLLPETLLAVFNVVAEFVRADPALAPELSSSQGSVEIFQTRVTRLLSNRLLRVSDDDTQVSALASLRALAARAETGALVDAQLADQLGGYSARNARALGVRQREQLGLIFGELVRRPDAVSSPAFAALSQPVTIAGGGQRPLWDSVLAAGGVDALVGTAAQNATASRGQVEFLRSVIASGGSQGNSLPNARAAISAYGRHLEQSAGPRALEDAAALRAAGDAAPFPGIGRDIRRTLDAPALQRLQ